MKDLHRAAHTQCGPSNASDGKRVRMRQVITPALIAVLGSATASALLASALLVVALTNAPLFFLAAVLTLCAGLLLVQGGVLMTAPALRLILGGVSRAE